MRSAHKCGGTSVDRAKRYVAFLLVMAGCGGMLFDFGGTIINPAIPYLESLRLYTTKELSHLTSAVVMSAAFAGLFAGTLAEWLGRKRVMLLAAFIAALACLPICLVPGYWTFYAGRTLQGVAAGLIGVVVPMYLAECLDAANRGKGAGIFQFMDVVGILFCSLVGVAVVHTLGGPNDPATTEAAKEAAWKAVFWSSAVPAVVFFIGALGLKESPVWLERKSRGLRASVADDPAGTPRDSLLQRKYVLPFVLAIVILACNQATGCNAIQYFALKMFMDAGLPDKTANLANVALWAVMLGMTAVACTLVDRKGRTFLLKAGTIGMVVADLMAGFVFLSLKEGWLVKSTLSGWLAVAGVSLFIAAFSIGPGVVVWLALSELMPNRIRANGMAIGLFINMMVAYLISDVFLQLVEDWGYGPVLFMLAGFAVLYFITAAFFLPETKGRTLEEIERMWDSKRAAESIR